MDVYLEVGPKRTFACAVEWPGWCRSGKAEEAALAGLIAYGPRYRAAIGSSWGFTPPVDVDEVAVVERLAGGGGTDFGVPSAESAADRRAMDEAELERLAGLLQKAWDTFDAAALAAAGKELRKGPRGGGRSRDKIVSHVLEAEEAYLVQIGGRRQDVAAGHLAIDARMGSVRALALATLTDQARGVPPPPNPRRRSALWSPRYFVRRSAWHALDHAWEIEDRVE